MIFLIYDYCTCFSVLHVFGCLFVTYQTNIIYTLLNSNLRGFLFSLELNKKVVQKKLNYFFPPQFTLNFSPDK